MRKWLGVAALVVILDQITKYVVRSTFSLHESIEVTPFFNLVLTYNRGISFGLFNDASGVNALVFSFAAAAIVAVLIYWLSRASSPFLAVAIGLIIGGAVGNVIDRLRLGAVVDFLDFHIGAVHWPAFNLADTAITFGVLGLLYVLDVTRADGR